MILYEMLVGSPPIDTKQFKRGALLEMLRMVREIDPPRPSTKLSTAETLPSIAASRDIEPEQLKRALGGDLDWIVMKALEKAPHAPLRDGQRVRRGRDAAPGTRAGRGRAAEPQLSDEEVRPQAPRRGDCRQHGPAELAGRHRGDDIRHDPGRAPTEGGGSGACRRSQGT